MKKTSKISNNEFKSLPESSWNINIKQMSSSIVKDNISKIKLQHLIVSVSVETKMYSEYGTFRKKLKIFAQVVNHFPLE